MRVTAASIKPPRMAAPLWFLADWSAFLSGAISGRWLSHEELCSGWHLPEAMSLTPKTPEACEATTEALTLFLQGNYDACLQTLQRIDLDDIITDNGIKVRH